MDGISLHFFGVLQQLDQVIERLDSVELRRVDQAHEGVPGPRSRDRAVEQRILAVHDGPFHHRFAGVVVQRCAGFAEEQGEWDPVLAHVGDGLAQPGVGLHLPALHLGAEPDLQARHDGTALALMEREPGRGIHLLPLGLGVVAVDLLQRSEQVLDRLGEPVFHLHEPPPGMGQAVGQDGVQLASLAHRVGGQGIAHLDGSRQPIGPVFQHGFEVLPSVVMAGDEQGDAVLPGPGEDGAGVDRLPSFPGDGGLVEDSHDRVVVEQHLALGGLAHQFRVGRSKEARSLEEDLPLGRDRQRNPEPSLELLNPVHGQTRSITQQAQHGRHALVVLLRAHPCGCGSREHLAAQVAAPSLQLVDGGWPAPPAGEAWIYSTGSPVPFRRTSTEALRPHWPDPRSKKHQAPSVGG